MIIGQPLADDTCLSEGNAHSQKIKSPGMKSSEGIESRPLRQFHLEIGNSDINVPAQEKNVYISELKVRKKMISSMVKYRKIEGVYGFT